jgi:hypothetical protein
VAEQVTVNHLVAGSIPARAAISRITVYNNRLAGAIFCWCIVLVHLRLPPTMNAPAPPPVARPGIYRRPPPQWITSHSGGRHLERVCRVPGLADSDDRRRTSGFPGPWVDYSIAPLIAELNQLGFETLACCSGLPEDHKPCDQLGGYILFAGPVRPQLPTLPTGLEWEGPGWLQSRFKHTPELSMKLWRQMGEPVTIRSDPGLLPAALRKAWLQLARSLTP